MMKTSPSTPTVASPTKSSRFNPFASFTSAPLDPLFAVQPVTNGQSPHSSSSSPDRPMGWLDAIPEQNSRESTMKIPPPINTTQRWYSTEWADAKSPGLRRVDSSASRNHTMPSSSTSDAVAFPSFSASDDEPDTPQNVGGSRQDDDAQTIDGRSSSSAASKLLKVLHTSSSRGNGDESDVESSSGAAVWRHSVSSSGNEDGDADEEDSDEDSGRRTPVVNNDDFGGNKTPRISTFPSAETLNGGSSSRVGSQGAGSTAVKAEA